MAHTHASRLHSQQLNPDDVVTFRSMALLALANIVAVALGVAAR